MATQAGYESVEAFVAEHLRALASQTSLTQPDALSEEQLRDSLAMCDRGMDEIAAGGGVDAREALLEIGRKRGFSLDG